MKTVAVVATLALLAVPLRALADPPPAQIPTVAPVSPPRAPRVPTKGAPAGPKRAGAKPKTHPKPSGPVPDVKLTLEAPTTRGRWTMHVVNEGAIPVRLAADARLLSFEVTPRGERKPVLCELPADMRPADDLDRPLVLPPKREYSESFEARLYCFGAHKSDALSSGAIVVARLGWTSRSGTTPPWEVAPIDGVDPVVAPLASIVAPPVGLPDEETPAAMTSTGPHGELDVPKLEIAGPAMIDAASVEGLSITVSLRNDGSRPVLVRFRPETIGFEVRGPNGVEHCGWPRSPTAATRELFSTLRAHGGDSLTVLLGDYCGTKTFEHAGLLVVRPQIDTRRAGAGDLGLRAFEGQLIATTPTLLRLHVGTAPPRVVRPRLDREQDDVTPSSTATPPQAPNAESTPPSAPAPSATPAPNPAK